ncbi:MAG: class I SAM-dependent methyltransferase [Planctomycetes bacterium]|nr:class I SAM-dependent methyltransferase [Planctomycetota bacterium]
MAEIPVEARQALAAGCVGLVAEDGKVVGPAEALHDHIRAAGRGAFSVWGTHVYLSSTDYSNCNQNGRGYALLIVDVGSPALREALARRDDLVLDLLHRNREYNNSVVANFLGYHQVTTSHLRRHGLATPRAALELGTGRTPYTALRFLAAGVERFVANDVQTIERSWPAARLRQLAGLLDLVDQDAGERLRARTVPAADGAGNVTVRGLEIADRCPFEQAPIGGGFDLIFSTSVLEHVGRPRQVVERMHELLWSGGHVWHCIDLRDHRDFDRPLDFLRLTVEQYAAIDTENRLRASDWLDLFCDCGFEIVDRQYSTLRAGGKGGNADLVHASVPPATPWVDDALRATFQPPFAAMDATDLSILGLTVLCRKP